MRLTRDYATNITNWFQDYQDSYHLGISAPDNDDWNSLEPALIETNGETVENLDVFAAIILSARKKNEYDQLPNLVEKKPFLKDLFDGDGGKKVDSAIRVFDSAANSIIYPEYIREALTLAE